jgi:chromosome segregation ATPase
LKRRKKRFEDEIQRLTKDNKRLKKDQEPSNATEERLMKENECLEAQRDQFEDAKLKLAGKFNQAIFDFTSSEEKHQSLKDAHERTGAELDAATQQIEDLEQENGNLERERSRLFQKLSKAKTESSNCTNELHRLETALGDANIRLETTTQRGKELEQRFQDVELKALRDLAAANKMAQKKLAGVEVKARKDIANAQAALHAPSSSSINADVDYSDPVEFSKSNRDLRLVVDKYKGEVRIDIREWYGDVRSRKVQMNCLACDKDPH